MITVGPLQRLDRLQQESIPRPLGVRVVAGFQLFKATVLISVALLLYFNPQVVTGSESFLHTLFFIAMRGNTAAMEAALQGGRLLPGIISCLGLYVGFLGVGLLGMKTWARRSLLFTSGVTVVLYAKSVLMSAGAETVGVHAQATDMHFHALVLLDAVVFVYFVRGTTAESFRLRASAFGRGRLQQFS